MRSSVSSEFRLLFVINKLRTLVFREDYNIVLLTLPGFSGVRFAEPFVFIVVICTCQSLRVLSFFFFFLLFFSFYHCIVCPSSIQNPTLVSSNFLVNYLILIRQIIQLFNLITRLV